MDSGKVSLIVSCLALLLSTPLSILGNILTPKVRDWWAVNTGRQRLEKRIRTLQEKLRVTEESWCFTDAEWEIFENSYWNNEIFLISGILALVLLFSMLLMQVSSLGVSVTQLSLSSSLAKQVSGNAELTGNMIQHILRSLTYAKRLLPLAPVLSLILSAMIIWRENVHSRNRANHSKIGRQDIRKRIDTLSQKLPVSPGQGASLQV